MEGVADRWWVEARKCLNQSPNPLITVKLSVKYFMLKNTGQILKKGKKYSVGLDKSQKQLDWEWEGDLGQLKTPSL